MPEKTSGRFNRRDMLLGTTAVTVSAAAALSAHIEEAQAQATTQGRKPNILVIWGDDIGQSDISAYTNGLMGFRTPNIDRIAREGMIFTDYYGEQSMTPFRNEKNSNWEGAYRVPAMVRWPGKIKPGSVSNDIMSHLGWVPTLGAAAGMPDVKERLLAGYTAGDKTFKVHLDGYNFLPYLTGQEAKSPRIDFFYFSDDGDLTGLRYDNFKFAFAIQPAVGTLEIWQKEYEHPRVPYIFNLRMDPYERAPITSNTYYDWMIDHIFLLVPAQAVVGEFLATFKDYPPRQKAASFTITQALEKLSVTSGD
jgi:arylsulfatase A-like enzyme